MVLRCKWFLPSVIAALVVSGCSNKGGNVDLNSFESAKTYFETEFKIKDKDWCKKFDLHSGSRLVVDIRNKEMLCIKPQGETLSWSYADFLNASNKPVSAVKLLDEENEAEFRQWLAAETPLTEFNYAGIIKYVGIDEQYSKSIRQTTDARVSDLDKVFSVIYNALVGDSTPFLTAYVSKESVLQKVYYGDYPSRVFNKNQFVRAVKDLSNSGSGQSPSAYSFIENAGVMHSRQCLHFCYWNYRQDKLYVYADDRQSYKLSETSVDPELGEEIKTQILSNPDKVFVMVIEDGQRKLRDLDSMFCDSLICVKLLTAELDKSTDVQPVAKAKEPTDLKKVVKAVVVVLSILVLVGVLVMLVYHRNELLSLLKKKTRRSTDSHKSSASASTVQSSGLAIKIKRILDAQKTPAESVSAILKVIDFECDSDLFRTWNQTKKESNAYRSFVSMKTEGEVLQYLDRVHDTFRTFPQIKSVSEIVREAKSISEDKKVQIASLLRFAEPALVKEYESLLATAENYTKCLSLFGKKITDLYEYLKDQTKTFNVFAEVKDMIERTEADSVKDSFDYWDRFHMILSMTDAYKAVCPYFDKVNMDAKFNKMMADIKSDLLTLYITRTMLNRLKEIEVDGNTFRKEIVEGQVKDMCRQFNEGRPLEYQLDINLPNVAGRIDQCVAILDMIRRDERMMAYCRKVWDRCAKNFSENISQNRDRGWLLGNSLQLGLYFADYLRHFVQGSEEIYCINYQYVKNDKPIDRVVDFIHNDYMYSDEFSNFVYEFLKEYNAVDIDIILNKFKIKL